VPAGIAAGLIAAVPGVIDYLGSVPPRSSARERATKHALLNVSSLTLFALSWLAERKHRRALPLALETAGTATLCVGGWMGGTLAYRNQIGVDHRYANAGKWQETRVDRQQPNALEEVGNGLETNQMKLVHVGGNRVAVGRTGKGYAAFQDRCTHKGGPLSDGVLMCGTVQCPWHGSQFDVHTGEVKAGPAEMKIETYDLRDQNKQIGA
jgi:nitrite reductase/ring-hydroxylating ferredoxin subunit